MRQRSIGPFQVSAIGLGCMNLSHAYGAPPDAAAAERLLLHALDAGVTFFDTAALYGFGANETLVGNVLSKHRSRFTLASKGGMAGVMFDDGMKRVIDGRPEAIRRNCEDSLRRLRTDVIDVYYLHRWDKTKVPIEDSVGAMSRLVEQGKVRTIGLSEVSAKTVRKAHAVHPITAVQTEYSLWTRNPEIAVIDTCREIGAAFVPFSPLARAFLTGTLTEVATLGEKDIRRTMPRFHGEAFAANLRLIDPLLEIARDAGTTPARLALAWMLAKAAHIVPIPGTRSIGHLDENIGAADVALDVATMTRLEALINENTVTGERYSAQSESEVDTERFDDATEGSTPR